MKVKMIETPSEKIIAKANTEYKVTDAINRTITLKKPGVLAEYRLVEALGDTAKNTVYTTMVLPLLYVAAIDDIPVSAPVKKSEVEALIQRLEEEGIKAVIQGVKTYFGLTEENEDVKDSLKK